MKPPDFEWDSEKRAKEKCQEEFSMHNVIYLICLL